MWLITWSNGKMKQFRLSLPHANTNHSTSEALKARIFKTSKSKRKRSKWIRKPHRRSISKDNPLRTNPCHRCSLMTGTRTRNGCGPGGSSLSWPASPASLSLRLMKRRPPPGRMESQTPIAAASAGSPLWSTGRSLGRAAGYSELELELLTPQQMATADGCGDGDYCGPMRGVLILLGYWQLNPLKRL